MEIVTKINYRGAKKFISFKTSIGKGFVAIHNTNNGPALGGLRLYKYNSDIEAENDVLQLAEAMTYKNSIVDLPFGGGKSVLILECNKYRFQALKEFADIVNALKGEYIVVDDVGTSVADMEYIRTFSQYARGIYYKGKQIPATAYGVYIVIKTIAEKRWFNGIKGRKIIIEGLGKVGYELCKLLSKDECKIYCYDLDKLKEQRVKDEFGAVVVTNFSNIQADFFAPCAMSDAINSKNIATLKTDYIVGGANNQILDNNIFQELDQKQILYVPDYLCNAGGVIDIYCEELVYSPDIVFQEIEKRIIKRLNYLFFEATRTRTTLLNIAKKFVEDKLKLQNK